MKYLNNPFNLRTGQNWKGLKLLSSQNAFCEFDDVCYAVRAFCCVLLSYRMRSITTVAKIISYYAPSTENNTASYIDFVKVGRSKDLFKDIVLHDYYSIGLFRPVELYVFARRVCQIESNYDLSFELFDNGYKMFIKDKFTKLINYE